jgi:hypothetical protein
MDLRETDSRKTIPPEENINAKEISKILAVICKLTSHIFASPPHP